MLLLASGCRTPAIPFQAADFNVVLVVVDALRADRLGAYGYPRPTTPRVDALAESGVVWTRAFTQSNWTCSAMASILTGVYPFVHKIYSSPEEAQNRFSLLPDELETAAETFKARGYATAAVTSAGWVSPQTNYGQGVDDFRLVDRKDEVIIQNAEEMIRARKGAKFFLYLHLLDLHDYFDLHESVPPFSGKTFDLSPPFRALFERPRAEIYGYLGAARNPSDVSSDDLAYLMDRYDSRLRQTDALVGRLADCLENEGVGKRTLLIVTADHGEAFFEHGRLIHGGDLLFNEVVRVPLIFHNEALFAKRRVIENPVESIDILPTVAEMTAPGGGGAPPSPQWQGRSLFSPNPNRVVLCEAASRDKMKVMYRDWSYIHDLRQDRGVLFNIEDDPGETRDVAAANSVVARRLARLLGQKISEGAALSRKVVPRDGPLDEKTRDVLKSLGYIR